MHRLASAGMKVDSKGEYSSQRESLQVLFSVCVEHRTGAEAQIGHRHHLKNNICVAISNCSKMSGATSKPCAVANSEQNNKRQRIVQFGIRHTVTTQLFYRHSIKKSDKNVSKKIV